jgi:hypothetical protein
VLYNASIVPCPGCVAVVNMGQQEARVETLFAELVQLRWVGGGRRVWLACTAKHAQLKLGRGRRRVSA